MYKVLIADDEPMIRKGLQVIIPWEEYGFEVIGTASNGKEALDRFNQEPVDLMIVDMKMPKMDGIQLIERIRSFDKNVHFLILSGHADFEYAKRAINSNVTGYLLKPVDEDELIESIVRIQKRLDDDIQAKQNVPIENRENVENFIYDILSVSDKNAISRLAAEWSKFQVDFEQAQVLLMRPRNRVNISYQSHREIKKKLIDHFEENKGIVFSKDNIVGILLFDTYETEWLLNNLYNEVNNIVSLEGFIFSISDAFTDIFQLNKAYEQAKEVIDGYFFYKNNLILSSHSQRLLYPMENDEQVTDEFLDNISEKIYYAIDISNEGAIEDFLFEVSQRLINNHLSEEAIKSKFALLYTMIVNRCSASKPDLMNEMSGASIASVEIYNLPTLQSVLKFIQTKMHEIIQFVDTGDQSGQIRKMEDFIHRNYQKSLKLESLAEVFNYNSAYLGKLFKNYTGEYFNTYLDKVRVEKAKELLREGLKVYQVAEQVGYSNVDYFHNKFKKYVGVSPSKYRKNVE